MEWITEMKEINLTRGKVTFIDDEDYERINQFKWYASEMSKSFYALRNSHQINYVRKSIYMHREILQLDDDNLLVDHINHNTLDNRKLNLRVCAKAENNRNRESHVGSHSKFKGVYHYSRGKSDFHFLSIICHNYKDYYLGLFKTEIEAALAYNEKAKELFGEFANLNQVSK